MQMTYVWLAAMVALLGIEAIAPGLVSIWFAIGALAATVAAALTAPLWLQCLIFACVSVAMLLFTRPLVKKYVNGRAQPTNADALIGKDCIVIEKIDAIEGSGAVKVGGKVWSAVGRDERMIFEPGCLVKAVEIRGVKLVVEPSVDI